MTAELTPETIEQAIRETWAELYAEMGEDAPELDEGELMDVVDGLLESEQTEPEEEPVEMAEVVEPEQPKQQELSVQFTRDGDNKLTGLSVVKREVLLSVDAQGHEHRGKGEGGGQFTSSGGGGSGSGQSEKDPQGRVGKTVTTIKKSQARKASKNPSGSDKESFIAAASRRAVDDGQPKFVFVNSFAGGGFDISGSISKHHKGDYFKLTPTENGVALQEFKTQEGSEQHKAAQSQQDDLDKKRAEWQQKSDDEKQKEIEQRQQKEKEIEDERQSLSGIEPDWNVYNKVMDLAKEADLSDPMDHDYMTLGRKQRSEAAMGEIGNLLYDHKGTRDLMTSLLRHRRLTEPQMKLLATVAGKLAAKKKQEATQ